MALVWNERNNVIGQRKRHGQRRCKCYITGNQSPQTPGKARQDSGNQEISPRDTQAQRNRSMGRSRGFP